MQTRLSLPLGLERLVAEFGSFSASALARHLARSMKALAHYLVWCTDSCVTGGHDTSAMPWFLQATV